MTLRLSLFVESTAQAGAAVSSLPTIVKSVPAVISHRKNATCESSQ